MFNDLNRFMPDVSGAVRRYKVSLSRHTELPSLKALELGSSSNLDIKGFARTEFERCNRVH